MLTSCSLGGYVTTSRRGGSRGRRRAFAGRSNVGKSSLLNRLTNTDRAIVCDLSGTTRDAIDQPVLNHGTTFVFVDTAGVRRAARVCAPSARVAVRPAVFKLPPGLPKPP